MIKQTFTHLKRIKLSSWKSELSQRFWSNVNTKIVKLWVTTFIVIFTFALRYSWFREAGGRVGGNEDCSAEEPGGPLHHQEELRGSSFNSNPRCYKKRTYRAASSSYQLLFPKRGVRESIHMCRFYLYEIIWSVYLYMMLRSMHINTELSVLWKSEDLNFLLQSPE